ncbi:Right origin-binding protein [Pseudoruegeria aquimaris]|uniref:Right origin-binding protein n=1 Tax=Pseudoruegeria aquimaris TaxID=393663 RepID=A0A1Y5RMK0_9RHOB|nr:AraC family transcriptional regulator [Pseudoruegeria aquimaris]SLN18311.1 Right origin-binding protein [Pseudoruegeria aquimaris]
MRLDRLTTFLTGLKVSDVAATVALEHNFFIHRQQDGKDFLLVSPEPSAGLGAPVACATLSWGFKSDLFRGANGGFSMRVGPDSSLHPMILLLEQELSAPRCGAPLLLAGYVEVLLVHFLRNALQQGLAEFGLMAGLADPRLARTLVAMHGSPDKAWSAEDLAALAGMSRSGYMDRFQKVMGEGPMGYLRRWRLSRAREALEAGERVAVVARRFGYGSTDAFTRAFRRAEGQLPSDLRRARSSVSSTSSPTLESF